MEKLIKQLEKEISKALKENTKLLNKVETDDYDMDEHDDIIYNDGLIAGLQTAIDLLKTP